MINLRFFLILSLCCFLIWGGAACFGPATSSLPTQQLAKAVLAEAGIGDRYNSYLGTAIEMGTASGTGQETKLMAWLRSLLVKEAGWQFAEPVYVNQLEALFSATELTELRNLAQQPLLKKLLQAEQAAYAADGQGRRQRLFQVWDRYNSGDFNPPADVLR